MERERYRYHRDERDEDRRRRASRERGYGFGYGRGREGDGDRFDGDEWRTRDDDRDEFDDFRRSGRNPERYRQSRWQRPELRYSGYEGSDDEFEDDRGRFFGGRSEVRDELGYGRERYATGGRSGRSFTGSSGRSPYGGSGGDPATAIYQVEAWTISGPHTGRGPKGYRRSDQQLIEEVCQRLERHGDVDASEIDVKCDNGVVTLEGKVDDRRTKRLVEECAESVYGVDDVMNHLEVDRGFFARIFGGGDGNGSDRDEAQRRSGKSQRSAS